MKESQLHQAFSHWLDGLQIPYIHSRTDRKTSTTKGDPDYLVAFCSKCLFIEIKVGKNQLSPDQKKRIAYLRKSGNKVVVARSLEECINACHNILCIKDNPRGFDADYTEQFKQLKATVASVGTASDMQLRGNSEEIPAAGTIFIGHIGPTPYVFEGSGSPGSAAKMLRKATPADLMELRQG